MADLVIGGKRHSPQRALRAVFMLVVLVVTAFVVAWFIYRRSVVYDVPGGEPARAAIVLDQPTPGAAPRLRWGDASLAMAGDLAVVRASGEPFAIGAAHGRLLAERLPAVAQAFRPTIDGVAGSGAWFGWTRRMRLDWRLRFVDDGVPDGHRRAIAGTVRGAGASGVASSFQDLIRQAAVLDVGVPARWTAEAHSRRLARSLTWVAPQATPGRLWAGHALALPGLGDGGDAEARPVISLVRPTGRIAWAGVGWAGLAGVVTGINARGLVVTVHPTATRDVRTTVAARPAALLARDVLELAEDLDAAIKLIEATPTLGAAAFVLVDGARGRWAVVERSPTKVGVRRDPPERAVGDVLMSPAFADDPENDRTRRISTTLARVARAEQLVRTPPVDAAAAAAVLRDRRSTSDEGLPLGHRAALDDASAVHVVLFDPASLAMWVADGPGAGARMRAFDLRHELLGEGDRPIPPADIPADPTADVQQVAAVRAARASLRRARAAWPGDRPRALEHVARALTDAPSLPEALVQSGAFAEARGDRAAMEAAWRRWLELGADDPGLEAGVRAALAP